jgi:3-oxoadipate enol-lactonase
MPHALSGCRIYYEVLGERCAPPLVMIRGLSRSSRYWGPLLHELQPHFRLLLLDNRGVGHSEVPWPPYTTRQMACDVAAVMEHAGLDHAHVFGMSLGGMIAQQLAIAHPHRVDRLVLGCTTPGGPLAHRPRLFARLALLRASLGARHRQVERMLALMVSEESARARPELGTWWSELLASEPPPLCGVIGQLFAALRHDASAELVRIRAPTLVLTGDDDLVIPPHNSQLLAERLPKAELLVLPGARHDFPTDRPRQTARAITAHLLAPT